MWLRHNMLNIKALGGGIKGTEVLRAVGLGSSIAVGQASLPEGWQNTQRLPWPSLLQTPPSSLSSPHSPLPQPHDKLVTIPVHLNVFILCIPLGEIRLCSLLVWRTGQTCKYNTHTHTHLSGL